VKHPLLDFGAPFLGTKARVIVLLGSSCCSILPLLSTSDGSGRGSCQVFGPEGARWKRGRGRSYSYSYSGASKTMESIEMEGETAFLGLKR
jgi:hypothetical protein